MPPAVSSPPSAALALEMFGPPSAPAAPPAKNPMVAIFEKMKPLPVVMARTVPDYDDDTDRRNDQRRKQASAARDIGPMPKVTDPALRTEVEGSFRRYCEVMHPEAISLGWSDKHLELIAVMELIVLLGGLTAFALPRGSGKALALDTIINTPDGMRLFGDIREGDFVFGSDGKPTRVSFATEIMHEKKCYEVEFYNGEKITACEDHLWTVEDKERRRKRAGGTHPTSVRTMTTKEMASVQVHSPRAGARFRIPVAAPIEYPKREFLIPPYMLGLWLGDGAANTTTMSSMPSDCEWFNARADALGYNILPTGEEDELKHQITKKGTNKASDDNFKKSLRAVGVLEEKDIPLDYLFAPAEDRMEMVRGLMDTDGYLDPSGKYEFSTCFPALADKFAWLLDSLSIQHTRTLKQGCGYKKDGVFVLCQDSHRFYINTRQPITTLPRRTPKSFPKTYDTTLNHMIVAIKKVPSVPVKCIQVEAENKLFLVGRKNIPTHNTTLAQFYAEWLLVTGRKRFLVIIGATDEAAEAILDAIKNSFRFCDPLLDLFPEVAYPIRCLDGLGKRTAGQSSDGAPTSMSWAAGELTLPTIKGSVSSGAVIKSRGITGSIRGLTHQTPDGIRLRPDLVLADDPQTSESASSPTQTAKRLSILNGDVMGLAGPGESMTLLVPCTVIQRGDLADQLLDKDKNPEWQSVRARLVEQWPENTALWDEYLELRASEMRRGQVGHPEATAFYIANRAEMDRASKVMWEARKLKHEVSAIQHAFHLKHRDPISFAAEMQNEPLANAASFGRLEARKLATRFDTTHRRVAPESTTQVTVAIDVQKNCLYFMMVAWNEANGGTVIDYGIFPGQIGVGLGLKSVELTLQHRYKASVSASIAQGIHDLADYLMGSEIAIEGGAGVLRPSLGLVDSGWGPEHDTVLNAVRSHQYANSLLAYKGLPVRATARPMAEWTKAPGTRAGLDWHVKKPSGRNSIRVAHADANAWRTRVAERLTSSEHEPSAIKFYLPKKNEGVPDHTHMAIQLCSEAPVEHDVNGMRRVEWGLLPNQDNHLWDCLVMNSVAANIMGIGPRSADPKEKGAFAEKRVSNIPEKAFSNREPEPGAKAKTARAEAPAQSRPSTARRVSELPTAPARRR